MKKKIVTFMCAAAMCVMSAFTLSGCGNKSGDNQMSFKDVYAMSAVSGVEYLMTQNGGTATAYSLNSALYAGDGFASATRPASVSDEVVTGIKDCLVMFEGILESGINQSIQKNTDEAFAGYSHVMTISFPGASAAQTFKMYYNEVATETDVEIDDGEEEIEVSTTLEGIMVAGDMQFDVKGVHEVETEGDEVETEIEFTTFSRENPRDFVKVSQSAEDGEVEYEYEIYKDGKKIQELEVEVERKNKRTEFEFSFKDKSGVVTEKNKYKIEKRDSSDTFEIKAVSGEAESKIIAKRVTGGYEFKYTNGYTETVEI